MRPSLPAALMVILALTAEGKAVARDMLSPQGEARPALQVSSPPTRESFAERRAVRGVALEGAETSETPELRAMRRFEEEAFPRAGAAYQASLSPTTPQGLAAGLEGRWGGTGDIPA